MIAVSFSTIPIYSAQLTPVSHIPERKTDFRPNYYADAPEFTSVCVCYIFISKHVLDYHN